MKKNKKAVDTRFDGSVQLAGGFGSLAAVQSAEALLRRAVMGCLLWENLFYESGESGAENIRSLVRQVPLEVASQVAIEARHFQKLRHVPLFIVREMARHPDLSSKPSLVSSTLESVIQRADELAEFLALYWEDGKQPLSKQVKLGLKRAFGKFEEYHFAKYDRDEGVKIRDALFLSHAKPDQERQELYKKIAERSLAIPNTWENRLSGGEDPKAVFTDMIESNTLGALAFLRNLRKMEESGVSKKTILKGFSQVKSKWLLPINYMSAAKYAPRYEKEIEELMLSGFSQIRKLPGHTVFVVDVSGSMGSNISGKSEFSRLDVACAMAMMAEATCESVSIYATAGSDSSRVHQTKLIPARRGFGMMDAIKSADRSLGGGGIFTRQCLEFIEPKESDADRIIIFSDSQDCDLPERRTPRPFGKYNYIVDVSAHAHGVNYDGVWTAEIAGWSDHFLTYIANLEGLNWQAQPEEEVIQ